MSEATPGPCCWPYCPRQRRESIPLCDKHAQDAWLDVQEDITSAIPVSPPRVNDHPGHVYFIQLGDRIKIGHSRNLHSRMMALPHERLIATTEGTVKDERRCHAAFAHLRVTGEWFIAAPELVEFAESLAS